MLPRAPGRTALPEKVTTNGELRAEIKIADKTWEVPVVVGTEDEHAIDIGKLRAQTGYVTLDPAYMNTASTKSAITYLDGERGILRYRGIPIDELAEKSTFVEVAYLLIYGHLPTKPELAGFSEQLTRHSMLHEDMKRFYDGYPGAPPPAPALQEAHDRGLLLQEVDRPALRLSQEQPQLLRELPQHDVLG